MAEGGYDRIPEWYDDDDTEYPDDDNADQTTPFFPKGASTPYQANVQEEIGMKKFQKSDRPETSYAETSFGGVDFEDLTKRFEKLKKNTKTGLLDTTKIPDKFVPNEEIKQEQIRRFKEFLKSRFPNNEIEKYPITYSRKKPMELVVLGPKGGETQILLSDGSDFTSKFLNATFVKKVLGPPAETIIQRINEELRQKKKEIKDLQQSESLLRTKNERIERLNQDLIMEQDKVDQLKQGQDNQEEIKRKEQLIKNKQDDLKSLKKETKELEKIKKKTGKARRKNQPT